jgi:hypothetical protein
MKLESNDCDDNPKQESDDKEVKKSQTGLGDYF